jgi:hypothetical protein
MSYHNSYKPHPLKSFATNRMFATETPQYLKNLGEEKSAQIQQAAALLLTGEKENAELAAAIAVGLDCRRAAWHMACEEYMNKRTDPENKQSVSAFATDCIGINEWYLQAFNEVAYSMGLKPYELKG